MKWFGPVKTVEELKRMYHTLTLMHHPDCGGTDADMAEINAEYETLFARVGNIHESTREPGETYTTETGDMADGYREVINALARFAAAGVLHIEICGSWLWISGKTREYKDYIRAAGCWWSANKGMWYWHPADKGRHWHKRPLSIDQIRDRYGSEAVDLGRRADAIPA